MPTHRQNMLLHIHRHSGFIRVKGKGLVHHNHLNERFQKMSLYGSGSVAHKHVGAGSSVIRHHNRPYETKSHSHHHKQAFKPIVFKM